MSSENSSSKPSEEVDLGQLFKLIGRAFDKFFNFIGSIFKGIFSVFIYSLKAIIVNYKIIGITMLTAFLIGFGLEKYQPRMYKSEMLVRPYFDSKFKLIYSIDYYNALIEEEAYEEIQKIFDIDIESAKQLMKFEVEVGPETENDRLLKYDKFLQSLDSNTVVGVSYKDFVTNRDLYSADVFEISVISKKKDVFGALELGLNKTFDNTYSRKMKQERDSFISLEKARIMKSIDQIDSLKGVYIEVLKNESNSRSQPRGLLSVKEGGGMSLAQERVKTKEFELLEAEFELRQELKNIEYQKLQSVGFFDTISSFQAIGEPYKPLKSIFSIIFPLLSFLLLIIGYLVSKSIRFIVNYEG